MAEPLAALLLAGESAVPTPDGWAGRSGRRACQVLEVLISTLDLADEEIAFEHRAEQLRHELDHRLLGEDLVRLLVGIGGAQRAEEGISWARERPWVPPRRPSEQNESDH